MSEPQQPTRSVPGELKISSQHEADGILITLEGELDLASAPRLDEELGRAEESGARLVRLDLSGLTFMDSTGMRTLLLAQRRAQETEHQLTLRRGPHQVQRVFELTGSLDTFTFED